MEHISVFLFGTIIAILYNEIKLLNNLNKILANKTFRKILNLIVYILLLFAFSIATREGLFSWMNINKYKDLPGLLFISLSVSLIILKEILVSGHISGFFELSVLRYAGKISYSIYLLNMICINYYFHYIHDNQTSAIYSSIILTFMFSTITYFLIEYPIQLCSNKMCGYFEMFLMDKKIKGC